MKITVIVLLAYATFLLILFKKDVYEFSVEISLVPPKIKVSFKKKDDRTSPALKSVNT